MGSTKLTPPPFDPGAEWESPLPPLCGVWVDPAGITWLATAEADQPRVVTESPFHPFAWITSTAALTEASARTERLTGDAPLDTLVHFADAAAYDTWYDQRNRTEPYEALRALENQFLLQRGARLFTGLTFSHLRRLQLDIETHCAEPDGFSDARRAGDRILAIGLGTATGPRLLELADMTDAAERHLLEEFNRALAAEDPDVIEGHNIFKFDLDYLRLRARRLKVPLAWGRFGQPATFRPSRLRIAERQLDFPRCDLPGRAVFDTYLMVQMYDLAARELPSYGLKAVALHLGLTNESDERTYLKPAAIQETFRTDRASFRAYLRDDLRETRALADLLLPGYVAQAKTFPLTLQEVCLRGTAFKADLLLLEKYYHARRALPLPTATQPFEGGYTRGVVTGVFKKVLHFDVASLYPSLLLLIGRNPVGDSLGAFIPLLRELRTERLSYKNLARDAATPELRREYQARQTSFKIIINSFYGYLGFDGARFGDSALAAEVTARGRELLQALITEFEKHGTTVLEADTDGLYLHAPTFYDHPEKLLNLVAGVLPAGIDLEFDGQYEAMFCYKVKNYALLENGEVTIRGSALRSRGLEPFLRDLSDALLHHLLGAGGPSPEQLLAEFRAALHARTLEVRRLSKTEFLSISPETYQHTIEIGGKKPRRAALEAALKMARPPRQGEPVSYYITTGDKARAPDWQRARPLEHFDPAKAPYDPDYYLRKLDDWVERYAAFLAPGTMASSQLQQGELL
jgi:DNA polymerase elongation subunit (family B)